MATVLPCLHISIIHLKLPYNYVKALHIPHTNSKFIIFTSFNKDESEKKIVIKIVYLTQKL